MEYFFISKKFYVLSAKKSYSQHIEGFKTLRNVPGKTNLYSDIFRPGREK